MVQLSFENLIPTRDGKQPRPWIEFTNLAGLAPYEQWFYHWVRNTGIAANYPDLDQGKTVLLSHLKERTKRYTPNIPDPNKGESWLRMVLMSGELVRLQPYPEQPSLTVAVLAESSEWKGGFEKISSPEFSAARRDLGIDKHWMLVFESIAEIEPESDVLMKVLLTQALDPSECAIIRV